MNSLLGYRENSGKEIANLSIYLFIFFLADEGEAASEYYAEENKDYAEENKDYAEENND